MIDKRILVVMMVTYLIQTIDKGALSFASVMGIIEDTNLQGNQVCPLNFTNYKLSAD